jgi:hypothetical protein
MIPKTFEEFHVVAREQAELKEPLDPSQGSDAAAVAHALMNWLAANTTAAQRADIAVALGKAVGL